MMICEMEAQNMMYALILSAKVLKIELDLNLYSFDTKSNIYRQNQQIAGWPLV